MTHFEQILAKQFERFCMMFKDFKELPKIEEQIYECLDKLADRRIDPCRRIKLSWGRVLELKKEKVGSNPLYKKDKDEELLVKKIWILLKRRKSIVDKAQKFGFVDNKKNVNASASSFSGKIDYAKLMDGYVDEKIFGDATDLDEFKKYCLDRKLLNIPDDVYETLFKFFVNQANTRYEKKIMHVLRKIYEERVTEQPRMKRSKPKRNTTAAADAYRKRRKRDSKYGKIKDNPLPIELDTIKEVSFREMCKQMKLSHIILRKLSDKGNLVNVSVCKVDKAVKRVEDHPCKNYLWYPNYFGITHETKLKNLRKVFNIVIDVDLKDNKEHYFWSKTKSLLLNEEDVCSKFEIPLPSYIVYSGSGLHFYYTFEQPFLTCYNEYSVDIVKLIHGTLIKRLSTYYNTKLDRISIVQGFRVPGSVSKKNTFVKAYKITNGFCGDVDDLANILFPKSSVWLMKEYMVCGNANYIDNLMTRFAYERITDDENYWGDEEYEYVTLKELSRSMIKRKTDRDLENQDVNKREKSLLWKRKSTFNMDLLAGEARQLVHFMKNLDKGNGGWAVSVFMKLLSNKICVGMRNMVCFGFGVVLRKCGATFDFVFDALMYLNRRACEKPLKYREIQSIARSSEKYVKMSWNRLKEFLGFFDANIPSTADCAV